MQNKIFDIKPIRLKRPGESSINFDEAYKEMAEEVMDWITDVDVKIDDVINDLKQTFDVNEILNGDGYFLARELEAKCNYESDMELANILGVFSFIIRNHCSEAEKKWVIDCEITPKYSVGDKVHVSRKNKIYEGEIVEIKNDMAQYTIFVEELGHVRSGVGTHGIIERFENVEEDFFDKKHWES